MKYLLDTNICIHFFKGKYKLDKQLNKVGIENCLISEITLAELVFGAENSSTPKKNHKLIQSLIELVSVIPIYNSINIYGKEKYA